jgi:hypothetical protein
LPEISNSFSKEIDSSLFKKAVVAFVEDFKLLSLSSIFFFEEELELINILIDFSFLVSQEGEFLSFFFSSS